LADLSFKDSAMPVVLVGGDSAGAETNVVASSVNGEVLSVDGLSSGGVYGELTLTTGGTSYEAKVGGSILANRKSLIVVALDDMFWGYNSSVTTLTGIPIYKNQTVIFSINPNSSFSIWLVAATNTKKARIAEST